MVNQLLVDEFFELLISNRLPFVFNPWNENCSVSDSAESFEIRKSNLRTVLNACAQLDSVHLWIGRDLGWRGGRRTGVPFVDEFSLDSYADSIGASQLNKATCNGRLRERTATEIALARSRISQPLFFWNVFPYHPHEPDNSTSNRMHTPDERRLGEQILLLVIRLVKFTSIVAIGNDAAKMVRKLNLECVCVRHPSYGGQTEFHQQLNKHYGFIEKPALQMEFFQETRTGPAQSY